MVTKSNTTGVSIRKGKKYEDTDTHGSRPSDNRGRDWNDAAASQRMLRTVETARSSEKAEEDFSLEPSEGAWPC